MRRSPSENYIRFRLITDRNESTDNIAKELSQEGVLVPSRQYLDEIRRELIVPKLFRPLDLGDPLSQAFLRKHGVWTMYFPRRGTDEAMEIFEDFSLRRQLEHLIAGPHPDDVVLDVMAKRAGYRLSDRGLAEFKHYYWNLKLVDLADLVEIATVTRDKTLLTLAKLPRSEANMVLSLVKQGIMPKELEDGFMYNTFKTIFACDALDNWNTRDPGLSRTTSIKMSFDGYTASGDRAKALLNRGVDLIAAVENSRVRPGTVDTPISSFIDVQAGKTPNPVGGLPPDENDLEEEKEKEKVVNGTKH